MAGPKRTRPTSRFRAPLSTLAVAVALALVAAACAADTSEPEAAAPAPAPAPTSPDPAPAADEPEEMVEDAPGPLVLYTNDFEDIIGERFTADTGIEIEVVQESGGVLLSRIAAERANPRWDVLLFDGPGSLFRLDEEGQFLRDVNPSNLSNLTAQAREIMPRNQSWFPVGTTASCVLVYRTDMIDPADAPSGIDDLTDPKYRGLIGQADPAVAAPAYPCVAQIFHERGDAAAKELYSGILGNGLSVFRTNGPLRRAIEAQDLAIGLISSPNGYLLANNPDVPAEVVWPEDGAPSSSRGTAIQASTARPNAALAFIEWMLEPSTQQFLTDEGGNDGWFLASVDGVTPKPGGPPADARYLIAPSAFAADQESAIKEWFADQAIN